MNNNSPSQKNTQESLGIGSFSYEQWREKFFIYVLRSASVLGVFLVGIAIPNTEQSLLLVYISLLLGLVIITFSPIPYSIRAILFLAALYALGTSILLAWGWNADGSLFLAAFAILTALLFDYRAGIVSTLISTGTVIWIGWQVLYGDLTLTTYQYGPGSLNNWLSYVIDMVAVIVIINFATYFLKREFNTLLEQIRNVVSYLNEERASLEDRIRDRTSELSRRSAQLESSAFVSRQAAAIQDAGTLMNEVVRLITDRFGYYHTGIFLADDAQRFVTLVAASSEGGKRMLQRGHRLEIGREGVVGYAAFEKRPRIALDVGMEAVYFNNPDLPETRSEIGLPLLVRNKLIGVLDIQSKEAQGFSDEDISTFQSMADQIALAIENARLISEGQMVIQQLQDLTSNTSFNAWRDYLGWKVKGYAYSPLGIVPLPDDYREEEPEENSQNTIHLPIVLRGRKIGSVTLKQKAQVSPWSSREQNLVQDVATQIGLALENARLLEQSQKQAVREQSINTITSKLSQALDIDSLMQSAVKELHQLPNVAEVSVFLGSARQDKKS